MNAKSKRNSSERSTDRVDRWVAAWRASEGPAERLTDDARNRILREAIERRKAASRRHVFAWTGVAASLIVAAMLPGWLAPDRSSAPSDHVEPSALAASTAEIPKIEAIRQDGSVVFLIANGGTTHQVTRSTSPQGSSGSRVQVRDGVYVDGIDRGENLVFYRVD